VFTASQSQRIFDVANYQVGADFSGPPQDSSYTPAELPQLTATYKYIPGVISATLGYSTKASDSGGILGNPLEIRAINADTFAQTAIWTEQDSEQPLTSLMAQLAAQRAAAVSSTIIPVGILAIGSATAMLLALVGNLIASWLSARSRLANFVVLRALGATPGQVAGVLTWEQSIIYTTGIGLGAVFGILLSLLVLPYIVYTSVASSGAGSDLSSGQFYIVQDVPPIQVVIPISLAIILAVLIAICVVAVAMMVRVVSQPSINQTLRLNED
jgi:ABC-type antimicrobial peptide transport system permease subunit